MKTISKISLLIIILSCIIALPTENFALHIQGDSISPTESTVDKYINNINGDRRDSGLETNTITNIVGKLLGFLYYASGFLLIITVASTGFRYIVDTPEVRGDLKRTMLPIIVGLVCVFFAASIAKFILKIGTATESVS